MASKASSRVLTDHDEIREWAEERGAKPAAVRRTESAEDVGIIRLRFPGFSREGALEDIEWDEWFEEFDDRNLALVVQYETANGQKSNFNKLVDRESAQSSERETGQRRRGESARSGSRAKKASGRASSRAGSSRSSGRSTSTRKKSAASTSRAREATGQHRSRKTNRRRAA